MVVELADVTEFHPFEESIAQYISPEMNRDAQQRWEARPRLRDELRPLRFNGRLADIQIQVMDDAAERMASARERGFMFKRGQPRSVTRDRFASHEDDGRALGFTYIANAKSSGRGVIGQVQAELWYQPQIECFGGDTAIQRIITKPKIETEKFIILEEASKRVALAALRNAISHARPHGFHN